ncbi:MAG: hypothetical protein ACKVX7_12290 [Planctomycetota bacterium]
MANPLTSDELEFVKAVENYKQSHDKHFLSWTEVLGIVRELGYRKSEQNKKHKPKDRDKDTDKEKVLSS